MLFRSRLEERGDGWRHGPRRAKQGPKERQQRTSWRRRGGGGRAGRGGGGAIWRREQAREWRREQPRDSGGEQAGIRLGFHPWLGVLCRCGALRVKWRATQRTCCNWAHTACWPKRHRPTMSGSELKSANISNGRGEKGGGRFSLFGVKERSR